MMIATTYIIVLTLICSDGKSGLVMAATSNGSDEQLILGAARAK